MSSLRLPPTISHNDNNRLIKFTDENVIKKFASITFSFSSSPHIYVGWHADGNEKFLSFSILYTYGFFFVIESSYCIDGFLQCTKLLNSLVSSCFPRRIQWKRLVFVRIESSLWCFSRLKIEYCNVDSEHYIDE